jgi:hypothetical protein
MNNSVEPNTTMRIPSRAAVLRIAVAASVLAPMSLAQVQTTFSIAARANDSVSGVGQLTTIDSLSVANGGLWMVEGDTNDPNTNTDGVVLRQGVLAAREGDLLAAPAGASIGAFGSGGAPLNSAGRWAWNYTLDGATTTSDSGIFFDNTLVLQEGNLSSAPQFTPGTPYIGFFGAKLNDAGQILVMASVEDTAITSTVDRALVFAVVDANGALLSENVLFKEGDLLPGQTTQFVADFATGPHGWDLNDNGDVLFIADLDGATTSDGVVYRNSALLAQEGAPSPIAGRNWSSLSTSQRVALNNAGDTVFTATLSGDMATDTVIVKNGAIFQQEGNPAPGVSGGWILTGFGTGPVDLDDQGNVYWFGDWNDTDTTRDTGIYRNDQLIVQEGVTVIGGQLLTAIATVQENLMVSDDGEWLIFEGTLRGLSTAVLVRMTLPVTTYCTAGTTTNGCVPAISAVGAPSASAGSGFTLSVLNVEGQKQGLFFYGVSGAVALPWASGSSSFLCVKSPTQRMGALASGGAVNACDGAFQQDWNLFRASTAVAIGQPFAAGDVVWAQAWFRDPPAVKTTNLSNGLQFTLQP